MTQLPASAADKSSKSRYIETALYFLKLGFIGFGGPLALVASMQRDLVERRKWMDPEAFARAFALIKAMPGPVAFMTSVFLGQRRAGWLGGLVAGVGLIAPSFAMLVLFGMFYEQWRGVRGADAFLTGLQATALGVILASLKGLGFSHRKKIIFWFLAFVAALITFLKPALEPFLILFSGLLTAGLLRLKMKSRPSHWLQNLKLLWIGGLQPPQLDMTTQALPVMQTTANFPDLFLSCFKAGAFVFGSGLAIVPMMEHDFVSRLGWLTHTEFMDALAFGQVTPGPVVITTTFIGYKSLGLAGAFVATSAIFLAPFLHMVTWFPRALNRMEKLPWIQAFLTGAIAAVCGAIFATVLKLAAPWINQPFAYLLIAAALLAGLLTKIPVWLVIPFGGALGYLIL